MNFIVFIGHPFMHELLALFAFLFIRCNGSKLDFAIIHKFGEAYILNNRTNLLVGIPKSTSLAPCSMLIKN